MRRTWGSQTLTCGREEFQKKNENKVSKKEAAAFQVRTVVTDCKVSKLQSFHFFLLRFWNTESVQMVVLLSKQCYCGE